MAKKSIYSHLRKPKVRSQWRSLFKMVHETGIAYSIVLASASPRRKTLLEWAEVRFSVLPSHVDETFPANLSPEEAAVHVAWKKSEAVLTSDAYLKDHRGEPVLAADTMVVLDGEIIGKPVDRSDAVAILTKLSGKTHRVVTGVAITDGTRSASFFDVTEVEFHGINRSEIEHYVDRYKPFDKAGAYAIQEWIGVVGIRRIDGDFYNVMGLPVSRVLSALKGFSLLNQA